MKNKQQEFSLMHYSERLFWLLMTSLVFFFAYYVIIAISNVNTRQVVLDWQEYTLLSRWAIVPYWSIDILYIISFFVIGSYRYLRIYSAQLMVVFLICGFGFFLNPVKVSFVDVHLQGALSIAFYQLSMVHLAFNQMSSVHAAMIMTLWLVYREYVSEKYRWIVHLYAILALLSVCLVWQYEIKQIVMGLGVAVLVAYLFPKETRWKIERYQYGQFKLLILRYFFSAVIFATLAIMYDLLWILWWPVITFLIQVLSYICLGTSVFQKNAQGYFSIPARIVFAPYHLVAWLSLYRRRKKFSQVYRVTPRIYLSALPQIPITMRNVIDMGAEWPRHRLTEKVNYHCLNFLELVVPSKQMLNRGVMLLTELEKKGSVLIYSPEAHERCVVIIVGWLMYTQKLKLIDAMKVVQAAKPDASLSLKHFGLLKEWYADHLESLRRF